MMKYLDCHGLTPDFYNESPVPSKGKILFLDDSTNNRGNEMIFRATPLIKPLL